MTSYLHLNSVTRSYVKSGIYSEVAIVPTKSITNEQSCQQSIKWDSEGSE